MLDLGKYISLYLSERKIDITIFMIPINEIINYSVYVYINININISIILIMNPTNIFFIYLITGCAVYIGNGISIFDKDPIDWTMGALYIGSITFFLLSLIILLINPIKDKNVPYSGYLCFAFLLITSFIADAVITATFIKENQSTDFWPMYNKIVPLSAKAIMLSIFLFNDGMEVRKAFNACTKSHQRQ